MNPRLALIAALALGVGLATGAHAQEAGSGGDQGWPCLGPPPDEPDKSWLWQGASYRAEWTSDRPVAALANEVTQRRMPETDAITRIAQFSTEGEEPGPAMERLGSGLIDLAAHEHRQVLNGIYRFNQRQAFLANRIEQAYAALADVPEDTADVTPETAAIREQLRWDTRVFEDRQRLLPIMCKIPGAINARLGTLLAAARSHGDAEMAGASYLVYVSNERAGELSIVDPVSQREIDRIAVGKRPRGMVLSPDGSTLYIALSGWPIGGPDVDESRLPPPDTSADGIAVMDLASRKIVRTLRGVEDPEQVAINPEGTRLYVSSESSAKLIMMDTAGTVMAELVVGGEPEGVAVSPDGKVVLATSEEDSTVAVVRGGDTPVVESRIKVGQRPRNSAFLGDGKALIPGEFDSSVSLIDFDAAKVLRTIDLASDDLPMDIRLHEKTALVTTGRGGRLVKIDPADASRLKPIIGTAIVGARPWGLAVSPDGKTAITANGPSQDITFVDIETMRVTGKVGSEGSPWGVVAVPLGSN